MNLLKTLVVAAVMVSAQAFAAQVHLDEQVNPRTFLPSCQGMASISRNHMGELVLMVANTANCSILDVQGHRSHGQLSNGAIIEEIPGQDVIVATVHSNSGAHSDVIMITTYPQHSHPGHATIFLDSRHNKFAALNSCGGTVELKVVHGQADLIFRNVRQCSNFDILENNGRPTQYPNKKIPGMNGDRTGSFTLPAYVLHYGHNGVLVTVKSDSGQHQDVILVQFYEL